MVMENGTPTLEDWFTSIWKRLESAKHRPRDPWRTPTFATAGPDGHPEARVVVLRQASLSDRQLEVHTDEASMKVASLRSNSSIAFCFWDHKRRLQLRLSGTALLHVGTDAATTWDALGQSAKRIYRVSPPPGTQIDGPANYQFDGAGRFVRIVCFIDRFDALELGRPSHRRMRGEFKDGQWSLCWVVP